MHFPCPLATAVDGGDLHGQPEAAWLGGDEALFQLIGPARMREVTGANHADPLAQCPRREMGYVGVLAAGAGKPGMDVQVCVEHSVTVASFRVRAAPAWIASPWPAMGAWHAGAGRV